MGVAARRKPKVPVSARNKRNNESPRKLANTPKRVRCVGRKTKPACARKLKRKCARKPKNAGKSKTRPGARPKKKLAAAPKKRPAGWLRWKRNVALKRRRVNTPKPRADG